MIERTILYTSKFPLSISIAIILDLVILFLISYQYFYGELPLLDTIIYIILSMMLVDKIVCPNAGKIILLKDKLILKYFFPWHLNYEFDIKNITDIETNQPYRKFYSQIFISFDNGSKKGYKIQSNYGIFQGLDSFENHFLRLKQNIKVRP